VEVVAGYLRVDHAQEEGVDYLFGHSEWEGVEEGYLLLFLFDR